MRVTHRPARQLAAAALCLAVSAPVRAELGGTLSLQSDARSRGLSYSGARPSLQLALAWDGREGWYGGGQLGQAVFDGAHRAGWLQLYGGRVVGLTPTLDAEAGLLTHVYRPLGDYDYHEVYAGLLGERWQLRAAFSPRYYGLRQRTLYLEWNARWPLGGNWAATSHAGVLHGSAGAAARYAAAPGDTRVDLRLGVSHPLGAGSELQLAWVAASRGGPYTWTEAPSRRALVLGLTTAF